MITLRKASRKHVVVGFLSARAQLPFLLGLLLVGACSRQGVSEPLPGGGNPRIQRILLRPHGNDRLDKGSELVTLAIGEELKLQVKAVWGIPSVEDVTPNATLAVEPASAGILTPGGVFRAQSPGLAHIRAELRVVYGPGRDEPLPYGATAPAGTRIVRLTDTLAVTIVAKEPPGEAEKAAGVHIQASRRDGMIELDTDPREAVNIEPKLAKILPLKDTRVYGLSDFLADSKVRGASARLIAGVRPADDIPPIGCQVTGSRLKESDWLLQQENAAIWVTGTPPPAVGVPLVVIGTFIENEHGSRLHATLVCRDFGPRKTSGHTLKPGEFLFSPLVDARSFWEDVAVTGDSVRVIDLGRAAVAFEALRPGTTVVEIIQYQSMNEDKPRTGSRFEIKVME